MEKQMKVAEPVNLRFRSVEGNERSGGKDSEDFVLVEIGQAHIEHQALAVIGLLQRVLAGFGETAAGYRHAKLLLPELAAA